MNNILREIPDQFHSDRLTLRAPRAGDGPAINGAILASLDTLRPWMPWAQQAPSLEESEIYAREAAARFFRREDLPLLLFLKGTDTLVGSSGLHKIDWSVPRMEIGYWIHSSFAGQGYVTEAVMAITEFAFITLQANRLEIRCDARNERSAAVARRCGFKLEGHLRYEDRSPVNNELRDTLVFGRIWQEVSPVKRP